MSDQPIEPMFVTDYTAQLRPFIPATHRGGIDWDGVRKVYEAHEDPEVLARDAFDEYKAEQAAGKPGKARKAPTGTGSGAGYPSPVQSDPAVRQQAIDMHVKERLGVDPIAKAVGAHRSTVKKVLEAEGVYNPIGIVRKKRVDAGVPKSDDVPAAEG